MRYRVLLFAFVTGLLVACGGGGQRQDKAEKKKSVEINSMLEAKREDLRAAKLIPAESTLSTDDDEAEYVIKRFGKPTEQLLHAGAEHELRVLSYEAANVRLTFAHGLNGPPGRWKLVPRLLESATDERITLKEAAVRLRLWQQQGKSETSAETVRKAPAGKSIKAENRKRHGNHSD